MNPTQYRNAIASAQTEPEVLAIVREYVASLSAQHVEAIPFISRGIACAEEVVDAVLEITRRELLTPGDGLDAGFLRDTASIFAAAAFRLTAITASAFVPAVVGEQRPAKA